MSDIKASAFGNGFSDALSGRLPSKEFDQQEIKQKYMAGYQAGTVRKSENFKKITEQENSESNQDPTSE